MLVVMAKCLLWSRRKDTQKSLTTGDSCICLRGAPWHLFSAMISLGFSVMLSVAFFNIPFFTFPGMVGTWEPRVSWVVPMLSQAGPCGSG